MTTQDNENDKTDQLVKSQEIDPNEKLQEVGQSEEVQDEIEKIIHAMKTLEEDKEKEAELEGKENQEVSHNPSHLPNVDKGDEGQSH